MLEAITTRRLAPMQRAATKHLPSPKELGWFVRRVRMKMFSPIALALRSRYSTLRAPSEQWLRTIENLPGISGDEKRFSGAAWWLSAFGKTHRLPCPAVTLGIMRNLLVLNPTLYCLRGRRWSVDSVPRVDGTPVPDRLCRQLGRWAMDIKSAFVFPAVNHRIIKADFRDVFGRWRFWLLVDENWKPIGGNPIPLHTSFSRAVAEMRHVIETRFEWLRKPQDTAPWSHYTLGGGALYQEWLLTLDNLPPVFRHPVHYDFHNVLLHLRTSRRWSSAGQKILFLEELQSDELQHRTARGRSRIESPFGLEIELPWQNSWYRLGINVLLWIAAVHGYAGVAVAPGNEQIRRYPSFFRCGGVELYDRTFLSALANAGNPWGAQVKPMHFGVELPDMVIAKAGNDYEVLDDKGELVGREFHDVEAARRFIDHSCRDSQIEAHGLLFTDVMREQIRQHGIPMFGNLKRR